MCPTCREEFTANNVEEFKINFALESLGTSKEDKPYDCEDQLLANGHKSPENTKTENLLECAEHELPVIHRCSTHKAWVCQKCIKRDHSSETCKMITISEELNIKKSSQLSQSQPLLNKFEETCKRSDNCRKHFKKLMEEHSEKILRYETITKNSQEYIQRIETLKNQMEKKYALFDKKLEILEGKRSFYDKSVENLKSSETIKGVSRYLDEVQNEAEKVQLISQEIESEIKLMLEEIKESRESSIEHSFGTQESSVSSTVRLWSAAIIFAGLALVYGCSVSYMQREKTSLEERLHEIEDNLLEEKQIKDEIWRQKTSLEKRLHQLEDNLLKEKKIKKDIMALFENGHVQTDGIITYMDFAWPNQERRRVHMKMIGNTARARQHLLLCTGPLGHSYIGIYFGIPAMQSKPGEKLRSIAYDGNMAAPLLKDVTINDGDHRHIPKASLVSSAITYENDSPNNGFFFGVS
ncbi:unnamed protein product [Meganyctiphanes norvegica]|uniref:B box-type domain-containing protein n=1 Tax=Meganyctiphanes norvegica TaxID=48144 RepID=A0AAV2Q971_MEGNR